MEKSSVMHSAALVPFSILVEELEQEVALGYVAKKLKGPLTLYNYTRKCTFDKHWNRATLVARGLVILTESSLGQNRIVAYPFPKFFNHSEVPTIPSLEGARIAEKMDGSLGIIFHAVGEWHVITRGSFDSEQSKWAQKRIPRASLCPGVTYLVEIIYPENKVVIPYQEEKLVLLGAYSSLGQEIFDLKSEFPLASTYQFDSIDQLLVTCQDLPADREGFVVRFSNGERLKFKGARYLELHRNLSGVTPKRIWEALRNCEDLKGDLPEEFYGDYDRIEGEFLVQFRETLSKVTALLYRAEGMDNKGVALSEQFDDNEKSLIFMGRRPNFWEQVEISGKVRNHLFDSFRPK